MKKLMGLICITFISTTIIAQQGKTIVLNKPDTDRGLSVMKAFELRASVQEFDTSMLSLQDLSDLLWATNGINRPESGKRTAPSAMNSQDIDVYVCMKQGFYLYDPKQNLLNLVAQGDHRAIIAGRQINMANAPVFLLLVSDISRFQRGEDSLKIGWANMDAGIVSQNIALFCAGTGLCTRPRASMDQQKLREILKLSKTQYPLLNNPVSYKKK